MRQKTFIAWLIFMTAGCLYGQGFSLGMEFKDGDKSPFYEAVYANVVINDDTTWIDNVGQRADVYFMSRSAVEYEKFVTDLNRGHSSFVTFFNENRSQLTKMTFTNGYGKAEYTLEIKIDTMWTGGTGAGAFVTGYMLLTDNNTRENVAEFCFNKVRGRAAPIFQLRSISVYRYLADALLKAIQ